MPNSKQEDTIPIACVPDAIPADERERWLEVGRRVYWAVDQVRELERGYAFRLPASTTTLKDVAESVSRERLCCPFVHWWIEIEPGACHAWLHITGPAGTKAFTRSAFEATGLLRPEIADAAGFRSASSQWLTTETLSEIIPALNARFPAGGTETG